MWTFKKNESYEFWTSITMHDEHIALVLCSVSGWITFIRVSVRAPQIAVAYLLRALYLWYMLAAWVCGVHVYMMRRQSLALIKPSLMVWSEGVSQGSKITPKRGGRICNRMGSCSRLWLVTGQVACRNGADLLAVVLIWGQSVLIFISLIIQWQRVLTLSLR